VTAYFVYVNYARARYFAPRAVAVDRGTTARVERPLEHPARHARYRAASGGPVVPTSHARQLLPEERCLNGEVFRYEVRPDGSTEALHVRESGEPLRCADGWVLNGR
jgi:hypothetical protein